MVSLVRCNPCTAAARLVTEDRAPADGGGDAPESDTGCGAAALREAAGDSLLDDRAWHGVDRLGARTVVRSTVTNLNCNYFPLAPQPVSKDTENESHEVFGGG